MKGSSDDPEFRYKRAQKAGRIGGTLGTPEKMAEIGRKGGLERAKRAKEARERAQPDPVGAVKTFLTGHEEKKVNEDEKVTEGHKEGK